MMIKFDKEKSVEVLKMDEKPIINVGTITLDTIDTNWGRRFTNVSLAIKISCFDENGNELSTYKEPIFLESFITPYSSSPELDVNRYVKASTLAPQGHCAYYQVEIELNGFIFKSDESLTIKIMDRAYIKKRLQDWEARLAALYAQIKEWTLDMPDYAVIEGKKIEMFEGLMQAFEVAPKEIPTIDLTKKGRIILSFKPKGLWAIGANGLIDLISMKGSYFLVDQAEKFNEPQWCLYFSRNPKKALSFNRDEFFRLLNAIS